MMMQSMFDVSKNFYGLFIEFFTQDNVLLHVEILFKEWFEFVKLDFMCHANNFDLDTIEHLSCH